MSDLVVDEGATPELANAVAAFEESEVAPEVETPVAEEAPAEVEIPPEEEVVVAEDPFTFKVKGEDKAFSKEQINNMLNREETFQKKNNTLQNSDEYKMGLLFSAAKGGDAQAQKKIKQILGEVSNLDELDAVEGEYDVDEKHKEVLQKAEDDAPFDDVRNEVDFQETMDKMRTSFSEKMPSNVFKDYWADPESRKVMYDLERSGRADELFAAFDEELTGLSSLDRAKINSDSTLFGNLFVEVLKSQNAKQDSGEPKVVENSDLSAVSAGDGSHSVPQGDSQVDFEKMSSVEFQEHCRKQGLELN